MDRAYATFVVKSADAERGEISGIASTPSVDRDGDEVLPRGAQFKLPLPLLWQHDQRQPIGMVTHAEPTDHGIEITAKVYRGVTASIDEAWSLIKAGLVRGLSVGFSILESSPRKGGRGKLITKWSWMELSCVVLAANVEASILSVKTADQRTLRRAGLLPALPKVPYAVLKAQHQRRVHEQRLAMPVTGAVLEKVVQGIGAHMGERFDLVDGRLASVHARLDKFRQLMDDHDTWLRELEDTRR